MTKWVYNFGGGKAEGAAKMKDLLGGKGANLAEMANLGLPVPPGFTITTEVCTHYYANAKSYPGELKHQVEAALAHIGAQVGRTFGDPKKPLLVSVRSGAPRVDAGHDGHGPEPRPQRRDREGRRPRNRQRTLRLRQLPPLHPDVRRRRARGQPRPFRRDPLVLQGRERPQPRHRHRRRKAGRRSSSATRRRSKRNSAAPSRKTRTNSSGARSAPSSVRGRTRAPTPIAACTRSPTPGARPSTSRRWSSATWATTARPASPSRATRPRAKPRSTANSLSTRKAKTLSPASARPNR